MSIMLSDEEIFIQIIYMKIKKAIENIKEMDTYNARCELEEAISFISKHNKQKENTNE